IYNFINNREQNFELIKLMAEDGDITKIIEEETTSMNYSNHILYIKTKGKVKKDEIKPILDYLNNSPYYKQIQQSIIESIKLKMVANERTLAQIDSLLA